MKTISLGFVLLAAIIFGGSAFAAEVPTIRNTTEPQQGHTTLKLEPLWTIGGEDDEVLLGTIERVLTLPDGRVMMMDSQLSHVLECSAEGEVIRELGRSGDGPGEATNPRDLVCFDDGTLGLVKVFPGQLVLLTPDGLPGGLIKLSAGDTPGGFVTMHRAMQGGGTLLIGGSVMTMDPGTPHQTRSFFLGRYDREGRQLVEYTRTDAAIDLSKGKYLESWQEFVWSRMGVATDGTVVVGIPRDEFEVSWFSPDGSLLRTATLPSQPWKRNKIAHDRMHGVLARQARHAPGTEATVAATEPVIADLLVRENGDVWCLTSESMWEAEAGTFAAYDVLDSNGHYAQRITVICAGDATSDRLLLAGDRAYRVDGYWDAVNRIEGSEAEADDEAEPMSVTCYRISEVQ